jgi:broad specificity phosphatase PhoE
MFTAFDRMVDYVIVVKASELYGGNCSEPAELSDDIMEQAKALAQSLAG